MSEPAAEDRARSIVDEWIRWGWFYIDHQMDDAITAAIRAAEEAATRKERERCASIARHSTSGHHLRPGKDEFWPHNGWRIAAAIEEG